MLGLRKPDLSVPAAKPLDVRKLVIQEIVQENPVKNTELEKLRVPLSLCEKLKNLWFNFSGPVDDVHEFQVEIECHESRHGFVVLVARWWQEKTDVGLILIDENDEVECELYSRDVRTWSAEEQAHLDDVWTEFAPVTQIKARPEPGPNMLCSCGSGKKTKKCCG